VQSSGFVFAGGVVAVRSPTSTSWSASPYYATPNYAISAYQHTPNGPILTVESNGNLGLIDPTASPSTWTTVGSVGVQPKRLRFKSGIGFVSNHGSDTITILIWNGVGTPSIG
jgi:hypothetical protein